MLLSMTGFAQKIIMISQDDAHAQLSIILKSVNSRFFDCTCKLPYALTHLEIDWIKLFKKKLYRGNVTLIIQVSNPNIFRGRVKPDSSLAQSYVKALETIQSEISLPGNVQITDLIQFPNIFYSEEQPIDKKNEEHIKKTVMEVLEMLVATRKVEGESSLEDLKKRTQLMYKEIKELDILSKQVMQQKKQAVAEKLGINSDTIPQGVADAQRAVYYLELDKTDIHEEIVRFKNHLETFQTCLNSPEEEKGRRLDFILQELGRETNTIAAKSSDGRISSMAINLKVEIEKSREQVQNIV